MFLYVLMYVFISLVISLLLDLCIYSFLSFGRYVFVMH